MPGLDALAGEAPAIRNQLIGIKIIKRNIRRRLDWVNVFIILV
jgi:hypothetical protein